LESIDIFWSKVVYTHQNKSRNLSVTAMPIVYEMPITRFG
jgi:hypothetical protein